MLYTSINIFTTYHNSWDAISPRSCVRAIFVKASTPFMVFNATKTIYEGPKLDA